MAKPQPIGKNEVQIGAFNIVVHSDYDKDDLVEMIQLKLKAAYEGELGHKAIRVNHQRGGANTFFINAGYEDTMYNEVTDYVLKVVNKEYAPLSFEFRIFLSYGDLKAVDEL